MKLYGELPAYRVRQVVADAAVLLWAAIWVRVGLWIDEVVNRLAAPARSLERAGYGLATPFADAGRRVAQVPVVGDALQAPFERAAGAGRTLARSGAAQQEVIHSLALWLGLWFALVPIALVVARYLPARLRWVREATAAHRLRHDAGDLELFALRAVATRPLHELRRAAPDPAGALAAGDHAQLAGLELRALGLALRPPGAPDGSDRRARRS